MLRFAIRLAKAFLAALRGRVSGDSSSGPRLLPELTALERATYGDTRQHVGHTQQKLWIATYCADRIAELSEWTAPTHLERIWGQTTVLNAYLFAGVLELASALDNMAQVVNELRDLGLSATRVDFPLLARPSTNLSISMWQETAEGRSVVAFYAEPTTAYFYELRNRLAHRTIARLYTKTLGLEGLGFVLPAPGQPTVAGGGPEAGQAMDDFRRRVERFISDFAELLV